MILKNFLKNNKTIELIKKRAINIFTLIDWCENFLERIPINLLNQDYLIERNYFKLKNYKELKLKKIGDFLFSVILLTISSPIIIIASLAIYLEDKGPILYSQNRTGHHQKIIKIWKLRTMYLDSEKMDFNGQKKMILE